MTDHETLVDTRPDSFKTVRRKIELGLACGVMLLGVLACGPLLFEPRLAPTSTPRPIASVDDLRFKDIETGRRFRALDRCIKNMIDASWRTTSYQLRGNFYESSWCRGAGARSDCQAAGSDFERRDQQVIKLNTLFYDQDYPQVFGLGFQALWVPKTAGWGASYSFAENGDGIVGDGWGVAFPEYTPPPAPPETTVNLGWKYGYTIYGPDRTTFEYSSDLPLREDLALYLSAPQAMRDRGLVGLLALAQKVDQAINTHQVNTCDLGPYLGRGLPPACTPRPLTLGEEAAEGLRAEAYFANQEKLLGDYYQEMYAAWMMAFPLDRCWP